MVNFTKLFKNAAVWKTIEIIRKRIEFKLVTNESKADKTV